MALTIYRGGTKKIAIALYNKSGEEIDCATMYNIEVKLIHQSTKEEYEKYSMLTQSGWIKVEVADLRLIIPINAAITQEMDVGNLEVMVTVYQTDTDFTNSQSVVKTKGTLAYVKDI
jgi:hypothetical protein